MAGKSLLLLKFGEFAAGALTAPAVVGGLSTFFSLYSELHPECPITSLSSPTRPLQHHSPYSETSTTTNDTSFIIPYPQSTDFASASQLPTARHVTERAVRTAPPFSSPRIGDLDTPRGTAYAIHPRLSIESNALT